MGNSTYITFTADGETDPVDVKQRGYESEGVEIMAVGSFGSGTITARLLCLDDVWRDIPGASYTAQFMKDVQVSNGSQIKLVMSGSTSPSAYCQIKSNSTE